MILCKQCIEAIRSRGEKIYVGEMITQDIDNDESIIKCDWCKEPDSTLYECK